MRTEEKLFDPDQTFSVELTCDTLRGKLYGAAAVTVSLFGGSTDAVAVRCDEERHVTTYESARQWLLQRGMHEAEVSELFVAAGVTNNVTR